MTNITGASPTKRFLALQTLLFVLLASIAAVAQLPTGTILGVVVGVANKATGTMVLASTLPFATLTPLYRAPSPQRVMDPIVLRRSRSEITKFKCKRMGS
jgi:hypothetical protein